MALSAILPVVGVLALLGGFVYLIRRHGTVARRQGSIQIVDRVAVDAKTSLLLVEVDGRRLLIGSGAGGMTTLAEPGSKAAARGSGS